MKAFFLKSKKLHIWLLADLLALAAYFLCRGNRVWMNALADHVTTPFKQMLGKLTYLTDISVMEVLTAAFAVFCTVHVVWSIVAVIRAKDGRGQRAYRAVLGAVCIAAACYAVFSLLWGVNFWTDDFQERSGIYAEDVAPEELLAVTVYFAQQLAETAEDVPRDENGVFAVPVEEILEKAPTVYDPLEEQMPFLAFDDPGVKSMAFSRLMSRMGFTGFYCAYTGESNVNVDAPASLLPSTVTHELAHQRGIASEQECNFLAVLAATTSGDAAYAYSGWLKGYIHLGNALYSISPEAYRAVRSLLPESVDADLVYHNVYWDQFRDTTVEKTATTVYDGLLKSYGEPLGVKSYGTVVDLLVAYYKDQA